MPPPRKGICDCGVLLLMAEDPECPVEFDASLNEFHITNRGAGYSLIYYCPFCGGSTPKSKRSQLFHTITDVEQKQLCELTKDLKTVQDVTTAFGEPDVRQPVGMVFAKPERDGKPGTTESYPVVIYTKLSEIADVHVMIYPTDRVAIRFQGKGVKKESV